MEYEPLFEPGFHDISMEEIKEIFVIQLPESNKRKNLVTRLNYYLQKLRDVGIKLEIWIDGSLATKKRNPVDIDIAIFATEEDVNMLPEEKKNLLKRLVADPVEIKLRYKCDIYFSVADDEKGRSYWRGWFGFDRDEKPKGIPRLILQ